MQYFGISEMANLCRSMREPLKPQENVRWRKDSIPVGATLSNSPLANLNFIFTALLETFREMPHRQIPDHSIHL
jgi:hypothetical protein